MNKQQFDALLARAKDSWLTIESYRLSFDESANDKTEKAKKLKGRVAIFAALTAVTATSEWIKFVKILETYDYVFEWINAATVILGAVSAYFAHRSSNSSFEEEAKSAWSNQLELGALQKKLSNFFSDLSFANSIDDTNPSLLIQQIDEKTKSIVNASVIDQNIWNEKAKQRMTDNPISKIVYDENAWQQQYDRDAGDADYIAEDADLIAVSRR